MTCKKNKKKKPNKLFIIIIVILIIVCSAKGILKSLFPLQYKDTIIKYSEMYNVDPNLVAAVINCESKYNEYAESSKGAIGLMQIMPETATWIAENLDMQDYTLEKLRTADVNIEMGTWYLSKLSNDFNGDYDLVIAAYNGGPGNVTKWLNDEKYSNNGVELTDIPFKETKGYLRNVSCNHRIYKLLYDLKLN